MSQLVLFFMGLPLVVKILVVVGCYITFLGICKLVGYTIGWGCVGAAVLKHKFDYGDLERGLREGQQETEEL